MSGVWKILSIIHKCQNFGTLLVLHRYILSALSRFEDKVFNEIQSALVETEMLEYILGVSWPPTHEDILEPIHGKVFREKCCSVYVVKGGWGLFKDLFLNRGLMKYQ